MLTQATKARGLVVPVEKEFHDFRDNAASPLGLQIIGQASDVAALRELEPLVAGQRILVKEHSPGFGAGGGEFQYRPDNSAFDNNGTVIVTTSGKRWVRVLPNQSTWHIDMFGVSPDTEMAYTLQGIMNSLAAQGGGTLQFRPSTNYRLNFTVEWDIGKVRLDGQACTFLCDLPQGVYAFKIISSSPNPYGSPLRNRLLAATGIEFAAVNRGVGRAFTLQGNGTTSKPAQFSMNNCVFRDFEYATVCQQNAYMFEFDHCSFTRNKAHIVLPASSGDSGERMTWINCDFTSNLYTEGDANTQSYGILSEAASSMRFINCSFDWHWCLLKAVNTQFFFEQCHFESPASNYVANPTTTYRYIVASGTTKIFIHNSFILLNYAAGGAQPREQSGIAYLADTHTRLSVSSSFVHVFGHQVWADGPGLVELRDLTNYNEFAPLLGRSLHANNNQIVNGNFSSNALPAKSIGWTASFESELITDDLTYSNAVTLDGAPYSLKCYNQFAGVTSSHTIDVPYEGGANYYSRLDVYAGVGEIIQAVERLFLDEYGNTVYRDLDVTKFGVANAWGYRRRTFNFASLGVSHRRIKRVKIQLRHNAGNNTPFYIGRVISQSY